MRGVKKATFQRLQFRQFLTFLVTVYTNFDGKMQKLDHSTHFPTVISMMFRMIHRDEQFLAVSQNKFPYIGRNLDLIKS